jgi:hypothetical protein
VKIDVGVGFIFTRAKFIPGFVSRILIENFPGVEGEGNENEKTKEEENKEEKEIGKESEKGEESEKDN